VSEHDLIAIVAAWCDTRRVQILRDGGTAEWTSIPPLLARLRAAVGSNATVRERSGGGGGSPVDFDALDILDRLAVTVADWTALVGLARRQALGSGLRQLAVHPWLPDGPDPLVLASVLDSLAVRADAHLCPPEVADTRYVRDTPCPRCGERSLASGMTGFGEPARVPVLAVALNRGLVRYVWCQACGQQWSRDQLEAIAAASARVPV